MVKITEIKLNNQIIIKYELLIKYWLWNNCKFIKAKILNKNWSSSSTVKEDTIVYYEPPMPEIIKSDEQFKKELNNTVKSRKISTSSSSSSKSEDSLTKFLNSQPQVFTQL